MENPFRFGGIVRGAHFADRASELAELEREMEDLGRIFLVSPRRYGKTCLLFNLLARLQDKGVAVAYVDLNAYPDLPSLAAGATQAISRALETDVDKLLKFFSGMRRLRPRVSLDPEGGLSAGLELASGRGEALQAFIEGLEQGESLAVRKERKLVVIIDEFSDLEKYDGETVEKALRSEIQRQERVGYIFAGSEQSVMLSMVNDRRRAFYKLGRIMGLGPISREEYVAFIAGWLKKGEIEFDPKQLIRLLELGNDIPYNVQRLCHILWETACGKGGSRVDQELIEALPETIARQDSPHYELIWRGITPPQRLLLMALKSEKDAKPFSREFQLRHGIGPSSSIKASLESLLRKGILLQEAGGPYRFADTFFPRWIDYIGALSGGPATKIS
jgi:uncharacterized protein